MYFKQQQFLIQTNRQILNYPESNGEPERDGDNERGEEDAEDSGNEWMSEWFEGSLGMDMENNWTIGKNARWQKMYNCILNVHLVSCF